mgnify:CR=1 FL=1
MMVVAVFPAMRAEFHAVLKHELLQHVHFLQNSQVAVDGVKAQARIYFAHPFVNVFRRQIALRLGKQLCQRSSLIGNTQPLPAHGADHLLRFHLGHLLSASPADVNRFAALKKWPPRNFYVIKKGGESKAGAIFASSRTRTFLQNE